VPDLRKIRSLVRLRRLYGFFAGERIARFLVLLVAYAASMSFTLWLAYLIRFDLSVPDHFAESFLICLAWIIPLKLIVLILFGHFRDSLSYFSTPDLTRLFGVCLGSSVMIAAVNYFAGVTVAPPRGVILTDLFLSCGMIAAGRIALRFLRERFLAPKTRKSRRIRRVGIIGAGDTGAQLCRDLQTKRWLGLKPIAFFDDTRYTKTRLHGVSLWGPPESLLDRRKGLALDEVIIAMPSAPPQRLREIVHILQEAKLPFRTIPAMSQLATGSVSVSHLRPVQIEDLLGRAEIEIDADDIRQMITGRVVMVTGAGGSIGSELCRQISSFGPRLLLMVERSEPALFPIEQELIEAGRKNLLVPLVADILDRARMEDIFERFRPEAIFHAAAHKHVPLMENQPREAIRNNVFGTAQVAELAHNYGAERFLLISTDKAINPTNVMGATKRMAEIRVQAMQTRPGTKTQFMAVRFGNVLGSSGSVVPIFARQIAAGGPVKVTHQNVTRYFMTIPEAVTLVLQAGSQPRGGDIFVLDMGQPVKIVDLARQMIELSGLKPEHDIRIEFTGLRPGEKLYEELSHSAENVAPTDHSKIMRFICDPPSDEEARTMLGELSAAIESNDPHSLKMLLKKLIPEYTPYVASPVSAASAPEKMPVSEPTSVALSSIAAEVATVG
jgi:FlaA1/EpsC-like NDP-sugar epimerase